MIKHLGDGRLEFYGAPLPENTVVEMTQSGRFTWYVITLNGKSASISLKERTATPGTRFRFRKFREEIPVGEGWRTELVRQAMQIILFGGTDEGR